tara:strand:- start:292 stop:714 length:423 start_codon:yes stop_codon:yes gene_type:complete
MAVKVMVLTEDVENPTRDKRKKTDWRHNAVWKKGTRFAVDTFDPGERFGDGSTGIKATTIALARRPYGVSVSNRRGHEYELLIVKLAETEKTIENILVEKGESAHTTICRSILQWMLDSGQMTAEEFENLYDAYYDRDKS